MKFGQKMGKIDTFREKLCIHMVFRNLFANEWRDRKAELYFEDIKIPLIDTWAIRVIPRFFRNWVNLNICWNEKYSSLTFPTWPCNVHYFWWWLWRVCKFDLSQYFCLRYHSTPDHVTNKWQLHVIPRFFRLIFDFKKIHSLNGNEPHCGYHGNTSRSCSDTFL